MKRIISFAIIFAIILTALSGCAFGQKLTAFGLYTRAANTIKRAGGIEADCDVTMSFNGELLSGMDITMHMNLKQNGGNSKTEIEVIGSSVATTTKIGSDVYVETMGHKLRYTLPESNDSNSSEGTNIDMTVLPKLAEEIFDNLEVFENENGGKSIAVRLDGDTISELLTDFAESGLDPEAGISFDNAVMTMNFDAHNDLSTMSVACDVVYDLFGLLELSGTITADYTFINFGTAPEVLAPADAEAYEYSGEYQG